MVGGYIYNNPVVGSTNPTTGANITSEDIKKAEKKSDTSFWKSIGNWWNDITGATAAMQHEAQEAQKQRDFEEQMSNTAILRQSADARAAGINTAMLYSNSASSGASTPTASSGRGHTAGGNLFNSLSSTINSAANLARTFNHDRNKGNDVNLKQVLNTIATAARLFK